MEGIHPLVVLEQLLVGAGGPGQVRNQARLIRGQRLLEEPHETKDPRQLVAPATPSSRESRWSRIRCLRRSSAPLTNTGSGGWGRAPRSGTERRRCNRMAIEFSAFGRAQGAPRPLVLIAGPCLIESEEHVHRMARGIRDAVGGGFVFKASFDKANRTSLDAYRGPGLVEGLRILAGLKAEGFSILTDIHEEIG